MIQELGKKVWEATEALLREFATNPTEPSFEELMKTHSIVDNAAVQISHEISKRRHPAHFTKCYKCLDKGMLPRCPECHITPDGNKLEASGDGGIR